MPTLLIIDDEPGILYSLKAALERGDTTVATAPTAKLGLAAVAREKPDAVILDVRLPDMSGLDAFVRIRELDPRLPVVVVTAHGSTDTAIEAMKRGAFEYLLKPIDLHQLDELIGKAFELRPMQATPNHIRGICGHRAHRHGSYCRSLCGDAGCVQGNWQSRFAGCDSSDPRRKR